MKSIWCLVAALVLGGCTEPAPPAAPAPPPRAPVPPARSPEGPEYLAIAPRAFGEALGPLLDHRRVGGLAVELLDAEQAYQDYGDGRPDAAALRRAVLARWEQSSGRLRYVLLVGDIPRDDEPADDRLPSFYLPKLDYHTHHHGEAHLFHRSLLHVDHDELAFPSDQPFAEPEEGAPRIQVGRVPARSAEEARGFVDKVIAYETTPPSGTWQRRVVMRAGPARFGDLIDRVIEQTALALLDDSVPYEYDVELVFAKPGSEYSYRLDRLGEKLTEQANAGAFLLAYVGHSSPAYFDSIDYRGQRYLIGSRTDFERMRIPVGAPLFVSLSCDVGAFDMSKGRRSIAEEAVLNPQGPVASFAATRVSHPYPNLLYGEAMIEQLLVERPATLGEAVANVKAAMLQRSNLIGERLSGIDTGMLKREHAALYNFFGDPATRLRYPEPLRVAVEGGAAVGAPLSVRLDSPVDGRAVVTLETRRSLMRPGTVPAEVIEALPLEEALAAMEKNYALASDKVLAETSADIAGGVGRAAFTAPDVPGEYVIKVLVNGKRTSAWGHALFAVSPRDASDVTSASRASGS